MKMPLLSIPVALLFIFSCNTGLVDSNTSTITINIAESIKNKGEVKLSEIARDIEFIQLETTKDCLINAEKSECFIACDNILVVSRKPVGVMLFDRKGKFIRRIGQVGKGPNEYTYIDAGCIDPSGQFIFLIDPFANKFYKYSISGDVLMEKPYNLFSLRWDLEKLKMVFIDRDHLALVPWSKGKSGNGFSKVLILDTNLAITDSLIKSPDDRGLAMNPVFRCELASTKGGVMLWQPDLGSVDYIYRNGKVLHKYQLNLGGTKSLEENLKKPEEFEQPPIHLTMVRDLPDYLVIFGFSSTQEFLSMVYDKKTGKAFSLEYPFNCKGFEQRKPQVFTDDLVGLPFIPLMEVNYFENQLYCWYDLQGKIDNQLDCIRNMNVLLPERRDEVIRQIKGRTEYENPMLIVMKMK